MSKNTYIKWINKSTGFEQDVDISKHDTYYIYGRNGTGKTNTAEYNDENNKTISSLSTKSIYFNVSSGNDTSETRKEFGTFFSSKESKNILKVLKSWSLIKKQDKQITINDLEGDNQIVSAIKNNIKDSELQEYILYKKYYDINSMINDKTLSKIFYEKYSKPDEIINEITIEKVISSYLKENSFSNEIILNSEIVKKEFLENAKNQSKLEVLNLWINNYNELIEKTTDLNIVIEEYNKELNENKSLKEIIKNSTKEKTELIWAIAKKYHKHSEWQKNICVYCNNKISQDRLKEIKKISDLKVYDYKETLVTKLSDIKNVLNNLPHTVESIKKIVRESYENEYDGLSLAKEQFSKITDDIKQINKTNEASKIQPIRNAKQLIESDLDVIINLFLTLSTTTIKNILRNKIIEILKPKIIKSKKDALKELSIEIKEPIIKSINQSLKKLKISRNLEIKLASPLNTFESQRAEIVDQDGKSIKYLSDGEKSTLSFVLFIEFAKIKITEAYKNSNQHIFILDDPINSNDVYVVAEKIKMIREITEHCYPNGDKSRPKGIVKVIILTHNSDLMIYNQEFLSLARNNEMLYKVTETEVKLIDFENQLIDDLQLYQKVIKKVYFSPDKRNLKMFLSLISRIHDHLKKIIKLIPAAFSDKLAILDNNLIKKYLFAAEKNSVKQEKIKDHFFNREILNNEEGQEFITKLITECATIIFNSKANDNFVLPKEIFENLLDEQIFIGEEKWEMIEWICDSAFKGTFFNDFDTEQTGIQQYLRHKNYLTAKDLSIIEMESNTSS